MADTSGAHPFVAALPPVTDYVTYLTLIEYNLKLDDLKLLDSLLQDENLTINIGWDLVLILLPFLPESEACLRTIARLGNPREVILKVTEALRIIQWSPESEDTDTSDGEQESEDGERDVSTNANGGLGNKNESRHSRQLRVATSRFVVLLEMLSTLHLRIKTKYPSRFVSTSLQAVLAAFSDVPSTAEILPLIESVAKLIQTLSGSRRPPLPPRQSTGRVETTTSGSGPAAADPEAQSGAVSEEEKAIQKRLLQAFVTHVVESYLTALASSSGEDAPGLLLSGQIFDQSFPGKKVPGRKDWSEKLRSLPGLETRNVAAMKLERLSRDVGLTTQNLLEAAMDATKQVSDVEDAEEAPPTSPDQIPLSAPGCLFAVAYRQVAQINASIGVPEDITPNFPNQAKAIKQVIGLEEAGGVATAGTEPEGVIDAVLALGLIALEGDTIGEPVDDEMFMQYLQTISLLSANCPSPSLRFHAHMLASAVLRSHPSDQLRLAFIRDTLEHCPYENLRASAVSWVKGETLEANPLGAPSASDSGRSIFASPVALQTLGPFLFPDLTQDLTTAYLSQSWTILKARLGFYLASLNFYYLLLVAKHLHDPLQVASLHEEHDIGGSMIGPLRQASTKFRKSLNGGELGDEEGPHGVGHALLDLDILDDVLSRVEQGVVALNLND